MSRYSDLGLAAPLRGSKEISNNKSGGPTLPNFRAGLRELCEQGLVSNHEDRRIMNNKSSVNGSYAQGLMDLRSTSSKLAKLAAQANFKPVNVRSSYNITRAGGRNSTLYSQQDESWEWLHETYLLLIAFIVEEDPDYSQLSSSNVTKDANVNSLSTHNQNYAEICRICLQAYSWKDSMVFTSCCDVPMGHRCKEEHEKKFLDCWWCGEDVEMQDEPASFVPAKVSGNLNASTNEPLALKPARAMESSVGATYQSPQNSAISNLNTTSTNGLTTGGFQKVNGTLQQHKESPYKASASASAGSELPQNGQLRDAGLSEDYRKRQAAKRYLIGGTKYLVEVCNKYGDEVNEEDKDEILDEILKALGGCKTFQSLIEQKIQGSSPDPAVQPAPVKPSEALIVFNSESDKDQTACKKCDDLEGRLKKAMNALLGL